MFDITVIEPDLPAAYGRRSPDILRTHRPRTTRPLKLSLRNYGVAARRTFQFCQAFWLKVNRLSRSPFGFYHPLASSLDSLPRRPDYAETHMNKHGGGDTAVHAASVAGSIQEFFRERVDSGVYATVATPLRSTHGRPQAGPVF